MRSFSTDVCVSAEGQRAGGDPNGDRQSQRLIGDASGTGQSDVVHVVENTRETREAACGEREYDTESIVMAVFVQDPDPPEESTSRCEAWYAVT